MFEYEKCNKTFEKRNSLSNHIKSHNDQKIKTKWMCPLCNDEIKSSRKRHVEYCNGLGKRSKRKKYSKSDLKGMTYENRYGEKSNEVKQKISKSLTGKNWLSSVKDINSFKEKCSKQMKLRYKNGWESKAGRCKKIDYESKIAGKIKIDGTWELKFAQYLDSINVIWYRNKKRWKYIGLDGKEHTYCPDFYVNDWLSFIEIKGYETDLDRCKWNQFPENLKIFKRKELKELQII